MRRSFVLSVFFLAAQARRAALTVHQQPVVKFGPALPPGMTDMLKQQIANALGAETTVRVKGNRCSSSGGVLSTISDFGKGEATLLNSSLKQFASVPLTGYGAQIANAMPQQQMPEGAQQMQIGRA